MHTALASESTYKALENILALALSSYSICLVQLGKLEFVFLLGPLLLFRQPRSRVIFFCQPSEVGRNQFPILGLVCLDSRFRRDEVNGVDQVER